MKTQSVEDPIVSFSVGLYRALLAAYPAQFRREYSPHMLQVFRDCCLHTVREKGAGAMTRLWALTLLDLTRSVAQQYLQKEPHLSGSQLIRVSGVALMLSSLPYVVQNVSVGTWLIGTVLLVVGILGVRARYAQLALDHRVSLSGMADDGQHTDLGHFDRFYEPLVDGTAPTRLQGAKLTTVKFIGNPSSVDDQRAWAQHARERGWMDRLFQYTCDEPELTCRWGDIGARAAAAHAADPEFRTLVTTTIQEADASGTTSVIDRLVPVINFMDDKAGLPYAGDQRPWYDPFLSDPSRELWMYQSCMSHDCGGAAGWATGWPTYVIDASAVRNRAMQWMLYRYGATGELYYETGYALATKRDAWTDQWAYTGNGDGTLFYPGTVAKIGGRTPIPIASIRLKMIREGMEDYEYLKLLSDVGDPALAQQIASQLFPHAYQSDGKTGPAFFLDDFTAKRNLSLSFVGDARPLPIPLSAVHIPHKKERPLSIRVEIKLRPFFHISDIPVTAPLPLPGNTCLHLDVWGNADGADKRLQVPARLLVKDGSAVAGSAAGSRQMFDYMDGRLTELRSALRVPERP